MNFDKLCVSDFNVQVLCEKLVDTADGMGGQKAVEGSLWQYDFEFWAAVEWSSPRKRVVADRVQTEIPVKIGTHYDVRFEDTTKRRLKLVQNGKVLRIVGAYNHKMQNRWSAIDCEEGTGQ